MSVGSHCDLGPDAMILMGGHEVGPVGLHIARILERKFKEELTEYSVVTVFGLRQLEKLTFVHMRCLNFDYVSMV